MKVCIAGAGAIGCLLGARLAKAGHSVSAMARGATLEALRTQGLGLEENGERQFFPVDASDDAAELGEQDLLVIAVKEPALNALAASLGPLIGSKTRVLVAMNGVPWWFFDGLSGPLQGAVLSSVDPDGRLRELIPTAQVLGCVVHLSCRNPQPGVSQLHFGNGLIVGQPDGGLCAETQAVIDALSGAGFDVSTSDQIQRDVWFKLWGNMTMNPVSALTRATTDRILGDELVNAFCSNAMCEAAAIGERIGCPIEQSPQERNAMTLKLGAMKTSMLQDVEAGKSLEVEALIGVVHEIAGRVGVEAPNIAALYGLTRLLSQSR
jgi:2-dehydropantoate 2-reductase